jgi:hypothetical protein
MYSFTQGKARNERNPDDEYRNGSTGYGRSMNNPRGMDLKFIPEAV